LNKCFRVSFREWAGVNELTTVLQGWVEEYNENYLHSALGWRPPNRVEKTYNFGYETLLRTA